MKDPFDAGPFHAGPPPRVWRRDAGAVVSGLCVGVAEDLDLPLPMIRMVAVLFALLPTGLAYIALTLLLRRFPAHASRMRPGRGRASGQAAPARAAALPTAQGWALLQHRFEMLEPRLKRIEAFVTSSDFELHRGFRHMER